MNTSTKSTAYRYEGRNHRRIRSLARSCSLKSDRHNSKHMTEGHGRRSPTRRPFLAFLLLSALFFPMFAGPVAAYPPQVSSREVAASNHPHALASSSSSQGVCFGNNHMNDSFIPRIAGSLRVALVQPVLTSTPYSQYSSG